MQTHPDVCRRKYKRFSAWHGTWCGTNVSDVAHATHAEWMLGRAEGLAPNKTHRVTISDLNKTPYRTFTKFKEEVLKQNL